MIYCLVKYDILPIEISYITFRIDVGYILFAIVLQVALLSFQ